MEEKHLIKFKLPMIYNLTVINHIVSLGYNRTGNKFQVTFNGSKGYLSHIEISSEGKQDERNNIIWVSLLRNKDGSLKSKTISIFYSDAGIRVEVQGEIPKLKKQTCAEDLKIEDDLPF